MCQTWTAKNHKKLFLDILTKQRLLLTITSQMLNYAKFETTNLRCKYQESQPLYS